MSQNLGPGADVIYEANVINPSQSQIDALMGVLLAKSPYKFKLYGKEYERPRREAVWGKTIKYSGTCIVPESQPNELVDMVMRHANESTDGGQFTWSLVNLYVDGNDYVAFHRDNEEDVRGHEVRTYSFGATRDFQLRPYVGSGKRKRGGTITIPVESGSCLSMRGERMQIDWEHGVPKRKKVKSSKKTGTARLSITLRR